MSTAPLTASSEPTVRGRPPTTESRLNLHLARKKRFYFLTIPGGIRLLELFLSALHLGSFGFFGTFYDKVTEQVPSPLFMATTRETFFLLANFNTFITVFYISVTSMMSDRSQKALTESLFLFLFDFIQFLMILSASVGLILLYQEDEVKNVYGQSAQTRRGLGVTGLLLGCLHLLGSFYDLGKYIRQTESHRTLPPTQID